MARRGLNRGLVPIIDLHEHNDLESSLHVLHTGNLK